MTKYIDNPVRQKNGKWIFNDADMNVLSLWVSRAAEELHREGAHALANQADEFQQKVYDMLNQMGYYDAVKKG